MYDEFDEENMTIWEDDFEGILNVRTLVINIFASKGLLLHMPAATWPCWIRGAFLFSISSISFCPLTEEAKRPSESTENFIIDIWTIARIYKRVVFGSSGFRIYEIVQGEKCAPKSWEVSVSMSKDAEKIHLKRYDLRWKHHDWICPRLKSTMVASTKKSWMMILHSSKDSKMPQSDRRKFSRNSNNKWTVSKVEDHIFREPLLPWVCVTLYDVESFISWYQ